MNLSSGTKFNLDNEALENSIMDENQIQEYVRWGELWYMRKVSPMVIMDLKTEIRSCAIKEVERMWINREIKVAGESLKYIMEVTNQVLEIFINSFNHSFKN